MESRDAAGSGGGELTVGRNILIGCRCGAVQGAVANAPASLGPRLVCMCDDCQAYARFLGRADDILDANGGTDVVPVRPAQFTITQGNDHLACVRLTANGTYRWYAGCCGTPLANTMASWKMPYAGLFRLAVKDGDIGRVRAKVYAKYGIGDLPHDAQAVISFGTVLRVLRFLVPGLLKRQHLPSPFFDADGRPAVEPRILQQDERARVYGLRQGSE